MEAGLAAVLMDVVGPADLAGRFVERIEISGTGTDVEQISRNCGRGKDSTVCVELPVNGGIGRLLRLLSSGGIGLRETRDSSKCY